MTFGALQHNMTRRLKNPYTTYMFGHNEVQELVRDEVGGRVILGHVRPAVGRDVAARQRPEMEDSRWHNHTAPDTMRWHCRRHHHTASDTMRLHCRRHHQSAAATKPPRRDLTDSEHSSTQIHDIITNNMVINWL